MLPRFKLALELLFIRVSRNDVHVNICASRVRHSYSLKLRDDILEHDVFLLGAHNKHCEDNVGSIPTVRPRIHAVTLSMKHVLS